MQVKVNAAIEDVRDWLGKALDTRDAEQRYFLVSRAYHVLAAITLAEQKCLEEWTNFATTHMRTLEEVEGRT